MGWLDARATEEIYTGKDAKMKSIPYLLSSLLAAENDAVIINTIFDLITPQDIGKEYGALYSCMIETWKRHNLIEPIALHIEITAKYTSDSHRTKLIKQLNDIWGLVCQPNFWKHYLSLALAEIKLNKLKVLGSGLADNEQSPKQVDDLLLTCKSEINLIESKYNLKQERGLTAITSDYVSCMDKQMSGGYADRIKTGLYYEKYITGFRPGDFVILAGRPKMGKSALANSIIAKVLQTGKRVMLINNEMDETSVINRLVANLYGIDIAMLSEPERMTEYQATQVLDVMECFRNLPLELYCFDMKTPLEIETEAKRLADSGRKVDFIVADYLQLFRTGEKHKSLYEEVSSLSWQFKMLAANLKVPVLALSQVNRKCEERPNKRPLPADLRESGSLEQDATAVMFIYRDEVYNENTQEPGIAEINVAINRNGKTGMDKYFVDFDHMRISNLELRSE